MNASRIRDGALTAALLLFVGLLVSPTLRSLARHVAYRLHVLSPPRTLAAGRPLGNVAVTNLSGETLSLYPRPGRRLLINVFATWCQPCQAEAPFLASTAPRLERTGIDVVGVDQSENAQSVERFAQTYRLDYPTYIDTNQSSRISLDARLIPTTILVGANGIVQRIHIGPIDESELLAMARTPR